MKYNILHKQIREGITMEFGKILKQLRTERNLSLGDIELKVEISKSLLSKYESGSTIPTLTNAMKLSAFFGVSLDYISGLSETRADTLPKEYVEVVDDCISQNIPANKLKDCVNLLKR
jgi:transcriptional regulator with XRE-family HTH domain